MLEMKTTKQKTLEKVLSQTEPSLVVLTKTDYALLKYLGEGGIATLSQLHLRYWRNYNKIKAQKRLLLFTKLNYVGRFYFTYLGIPETVYYITTIGLEVLPKLQQQGLMVGKPTRPEIKQQLMAQDFRQWFETELSKSEAKLIKWKNERTLRSEQRKKQLKETQSFFTALNFDEIADAQAIVQKIDNATEVIDIEIDGEYYSEMLQQKLDNYAKFTNTVYWVTRGPKRFKRLEKEIAATRTKNIKLIGLDQLASKQNLG